MKSARLISLLFFLSALLSFSACSRSAEPTSPSEEQQSAQVQENQPTSESETENSADDSLQQQTNQDTKEEDFKLPSISDDSDSNCSKKEFGYFSLLLPKNYVIESNIIYEDNTELARKIAEIESVDMISLIQNLLFQLMTGYILMQKIFLSAVLEFTPEKDTQYKKKYQKGA